MRGLGGAGKLAYKMIDKLHNYYGIVIRQISDKSLEEMKRVIWEAFSMHVPPKTNRVMTITVALAGIDIRLRGNTQNQNKSLNAMIWNRVAKETYIGLKQFEIMLTLVTLLPFVPMRNWG